MQANRKASEVLHEELQRKGQSGASERALRPLRIRYWLTQFEEEGIVRMFMRENGRWTVNARGFRGTRSYSNDEIEAFIHGVDAGLDR